MNINADKQTLIFAKNRNVCIDFASVFGKIEILKEFEMEGQYMIGPIVRELLLQNQETFLVPAENVANVMYQHPLSHGLLVLSKVGYTKIPVLGKDDRFVGLVSLSNVVNKMMDLQTISMEPLEGLTVADVMETDVPTIDENWELEEVLHLLVDASFLPVVTEDKVFKGIITRKELLKAVNYMVHELERQNIVSPKIDVDELRERIDIVS